MKPNLIRLIVIALALAAIVAVTIAAEPIRPNILFIQPDGKPGYYGGTSCASAQVAGLCVSLWAQFPDVDAKTLKAAIIQGGEPLPGSPNRAPIVNAAATIDLLRRGAVKPLPPSPPPVRLTDWRKQIESCDEIERTLAVSYLGNLAFESPLSPAERASTWRRCLADASAVVRIAALRLDPGDEPDTAQIAAIWKLVRTDPHPGVRGWSAYFLCGVAWNENADWAEILPLLYDPNWTVRWSVNRAWDRRFPNGPKFIIARNPEDVKPTADKLVELFRKSQPADEVSGHKATSSPSQ